MIEMKVSYQGEKHCELTHILSGAVISTDAPKDNHGRGEAFSPTDLCTVSLGACMLTVMAIKAEAKGLELKGSYAKVLKEMSSAPRKIEKIEVDLHLPKRADDEMKALLRETAMNCPVKLSLNPDLNFQIRFIYDL